MNIKNEQAHRLARELAAATGETVTTAVSTALRERLERVKGAREPGLADRLMALGRRASADLDERYRSLDHGEWLYDEQGLPR